MTTSPRTPPGRDPVPRLLAAYASGAFPMADGRDGPVRFHRADPRGVLPLTPDGLRLARSLRSAVRRGTFVITSDRAFDAVIRACAETPREGPWINDWILHAYNALHRAGHAHSIEAWLDGVLVGGLYGVRLGAAFFGESMFSRPDLGGTDASKVCLVHLWHHLVNQGFTLLDCQIANDHTATLGVIEIPEAVYLEQLADAITLPRAWDAARVGDNPFGA